MSRPGDSRQAGFTLVEVLISLGVFLVALGAIVVALRSNQSAYIRSERKVNVQQNVRLALNEMMTEIRMAGYFPENFASPAADPPLVNPIQIATDRALAIHGDLDGSGVSEVFLFCLDGSALRRSKAPDGDTAAYWCPAGEILAENVTDLHFTYLDEDKAPLPAPPSVPYQLDGQDAGSVPDLGNTTQRSAIRRVVVSITGSEVVPGQAPHTLTLGSEVRLRNVR